MSARGETILNQGIRNGLTEKIIFKQTPQRSDLCKIIIGCTCLDQRHVPQICMLKP